jgi:hypothetical protein
MCSTRASLTPRALSRLAAACRGLGFGAALPGASADLPAAPLLGARLRLVHEGLQLP